jgi:hypothetical protein
MIRRYLPKSIEELVHWYERYVSPLALVAGFISDNLFLTRRVDLLRTNLLFFIYLVVAALGVAIINVIETGRIKTPWVLKAAPFVPLAAQFAFGGLFSGYLSLYSRSASFPASWIFVLLLAALLLGNERFTRLYARLSFQVALYFTVLFSFLIFFLPVIFHSIGPYMFLASGVASLAAIALFSYALSFIAPELVRAQQTEIARAVAIIFILFNALYFLGFIPPLPLAIKEAGVYHSVVREPDGTYELLGEPLPWYEAYLRYNTVFQAAPGESAYAYSAIFAPAGLSTIILHQWQRYDTATNSWITTDTLRFEIEGGRDGGYRGYSMKSGITAGKWRVNVITQYGQIIGRISFTVVDVPAAVPLVESAN